MDSDTKEWVNGQIKRGFDHLHGAITSNSKPQFDGPRERYRRRLEFAQQQFTAEIDALYRAE